MSGTCGFSGGTGHHTHAAAFHVVWRAPAAQLAPPAYAARCTMWCAPRPCNCYRRFGRGLRTSTRAPGPDVSRPPRRAPRQPPGRGALGWCPSVCAMRPAAAGRSTHSQQDSGVFGCLLRPGGQLAGLGGCAARPLLSCAPNSPAQLTGGSYHGLCLSRGAYLDRPTSSPSNCDAFVVPNVLNRRPQAIASPARTTRDLHAPQDQSEPLDGHILCLIGVTPLRLRVGGALPLGRARWMDRGLCSTRASFAHATG